MPHYRGWRKTVALHWGWCCNPASAEHQHVLAGISTALGAR
ncbi:hypothetical protein HMPREF9607_02741 [Cutibacterium modestum HL044PA1]|uniref:Uncharacterized protein n=1 Tax=Cutibacterium modestum HL044PA1 TaxID=765109 RepID=A0ABN0C1U7_9ACTN|nr:hypothetical protein HMPREF9607_02741 [Cutibacterium modestum HL044PA1]